MTKSATRTAKNHTPGTPIAARAVLDLGRVSGTYEFEQITVATDDPVNLSITLANSDGKSIKVMLPRAEVRKLLTWRMLVNL
jgi:hypothetical protein